MFIKKDTRKIEQILSASNTNNDEESQGTKAKHLKFSNRSSEFQRSVAILAKPIFRPAFDNLKSLNLYNNNLTSVNDIGFLSSSPIEEINLGQNTLSMLPLEFGTLKTLTTVWIDDNQFTNFPLSLCQLDQLQTLRFSNNLLEAIPDTIAQLSQLTTLALDNNELEVFPDAILQLNKLQHLNLRQNKLSALSPDLDYLPSLTTLMVSSNNLESLPQCLEQMMTLESIYANGNHIDTFSFGVLALPKLALLNVANNKITLLPEVWMNGERGVFHEGARELVRTEAAGQVKLVATFLGNPLIL